MINELIIINTRPESEPLLFTLVFMGLLYYRLTLYVKVANKSKEDMIATFNESIALIKYFDTTQ
jgi:hypothetical protein